jgi:hypothetical protein
MCVEAQCKERKGSYIPSPSSSAVLDKDTENCLNEAVIPSATLENSLAAGLPRPMAE